MIYKHILIHTHQCANHQKYLKETEGEVEGEVEGKRTEGMKQ